MSGRTAPRGTGKKTTGQEMIVVEVGGEVWGTAQEPVPAGTAITGVPAAAPSAADDIVTFLEARRQELDACLQGSGCDPPVPPHQGWLTVTRAARAVGGDDLANAVAELYALHGRLRAILERGPDANLPAEVVTRLEELRRRELLTHTSRTIAAVRRPRSEPVAD
ncbi:hypothetical protein ER308_00790 [Egibacter rhizosphaerae]|uniref:Uncharacterized protein n=1 Tax=Egibacter rhizosphaerae TaxID=1670831 RepID=A0A411YAP7_9ACTN|nr:hypothetical protein [Egibacter rhizosphaerae]QBI18249.1 hypothetical protein ER308_00790 [Egibacter rhizosphaerae]